jgi:hypothetical protein
MITCLHAAKMRVARFFARSLALLSSFNQFIIDAREQRAILEAERLRRRYRPSSKNDDDLPIVR